jgi:uncharacterized alpha-E superfamily protein
MLSRVADSVFWIGRYVERAENTARLLDVALRSLRERPFTLGGGGSQMNELRLVLVALGAVDDYTRRYGDLSEDGLAAYLMIDSDNPHSVISAMTTARNNARSVRESISTEMWEELNRAYFMVNRVASARVLVDGTSDFCASIRLRSQLFQGVADATMPHDESWRFLQAGRYLERAGTTARVLDARGSEFASPEQLSRAEDVHHWLNILRSVSAYEALMRLRPGGVQPAAVAQFLLLDRRFPRSVAFGVERVHEQLEAIDRELGLQREEGPAQVAGALAAQLRYMRFGEYGGNRLVVFLTTLVDQIDEIGDVIRRSYFEQSSLESGVA